MPRVAIKWKQYKMADLSKWIHIRMKESGIRQWQMGEALNITQSAFSYKLRENMFTYKDLLVIFKMLGATDEEILKIMKP